MNELAIMGGALSFDNVLDRLLSDCSNQHYDAKEFVKTVNTESFSKLWTHVQTSNNKRGTYIPSHSTVFENLHKAIDAFFWGEIIRETGVLDYVKNSLRTEWKTAISEMKTPPFTRENVLSTLLPMFKDLPRLYAERLNDTFYKLSREHYTNNSSGFGKRMIFTVAYPTQYFFNLSHDMCGYINDLRSTIAQITGGSQLSHNDTYSLINRMIKNAEYGEWVKLDDYVAFKLFKKGTCHVEIAPDIAEILNNILATTFNNEVPDLSREKVERAKRNAKSNKKKFHEKAFMMIDVPTAEVCHGYVKNVDGVWKLSSQGKKSEMLSNVMYHLDGKLENGFYEFDYNPTTVLKYIVETGKLPDYKSFQYYPTPPKIVSAIKKHMKNFNAENGKVLEPSAGTGKLVDWVEDKTNVDCVEVSDLQCAVLKAKGYNVTNADFMKMTPNPIYNLVVMNPPYNMNQCFEHIQHAEKFVDLENGGQIVVVVPLGHKQRYLDNGFLIVDEFDKGFERTGIATVLMCKYSREIRLGYME